MPLLTHTAVWSWCGDELLDHGGESPRLRDDPALEHAVRVVFAPGGPRGHEPAVRDALLAAMGAWDECLLWITGWGVWPSSEDWPRYYALRLRHGSRMSIDDAPAHLAAAGDREELGEVLLQVLENGWDAVLVARHAGPVVPVRVRISHDGWAEVFSAHPVDLRLPGLPATPRSAHRPGHP